MRIFIMCPPEFATGGTELLHQFSYVLSSMDIENYMVYPKKKEVICPTPSSFLKYNAKYVSEYLDAADSVLVLPETMVHYADYCKKGKLVIWWLSVNNYVLSYSKRFVEGNYDCFKLREKDNVYHFVQSYYAALFLRTMLNIERSYYLTDYINDDIIRTAEEKGKYCKRDDVVLYNPKKGFENIEPLIRKSQERIKWIPLQNMSPVEMAEAMCSAKVYIDFGQHPGKDRIPREAAACGCCIVTNRLGSAAYQQDINIPMLYKLDKMNDYDLVLETIYDLIDNYQERTGAFDEYRAMILGEKELFFDETRMFISIMQRAVGKEDNTSIQNETLDSVTLLKNAAKQMEQMLDGMLKECGEVGKTETIKTMLTIDYIMHIMRETIYAELKYLAQDEKE